MITKNELESKLLDIFEKYSKYGISLTKEELISDVMGVVSNPPLEFSIIPTYDEENKQLYLDISYRRPPTERVCIDLVV